jgi:hypothetical protein
LITFTVLVWLVTLAKLPVAWRQRQDVLARAFWLALVSLAICMTLDQPPLYRAIGEWTGVPNLAFPITYAAGVIAGFWCQAFLWATASSADAVQRIRRRAGFAAATVAMIALSAPFGPTLLPNTHDVTHLPPQHWGDLLLRLSIAAWTALSLGDIAWLCLRFSRQAAGRPLRIGMLLASAGCVLVITRLLLEYGVYSVLAWHRDHQSTGELALIRWLNLGTLLGFAMIALGLGVPALTRRVAAIAAWVRDLTRYRRLRALWLALRPVSATLNWPGYRLPLIHRVPLVAVSGRLYRRVIEIQDGFLAIRPYRDAELERAMHREAIHRGLPAHSATAFVEARTVRTAVEGFLRGIPVERCAVDTARSQEQESQDEVRHLLTVASFLRD